jgi:hypothetical protein
VNDSDAKVCKEWGKKFSSGKTANASRTQAQGGGGKSVVCPRCKKPRRITGGPFVKWREPDGPINQYWEEVKFCMLECSHEYFIGKTGRTKPWEP